MLATVWINLLYTSAGAFTRSEVMFIAVLFNIFEAFGELGTTMLDRPNVNKH